MVKYKRRDRNRKNKHISEGVVYEEINRIINTFGSFSRWVFI